MKEEGGLVLEELVEDEVDELELVDELDSVDIEDEVDELSELSESLESEEELQEDFLAFVFIFRKSPLFPEPGISILCRFT